MTDAAPTLIEPRYPRPAVIHAAAVDAGLLNSWLARGHLKLDEQHPGRGKSRLFSARDAVQVSIMARLGEQGLQVTTSGPLAKDFADLFARSGLRWGDVLETTHQGLKRAERLVSSPEHLRWGSLTSDEGTAYRYAAMVRHLVRQQIDLQALPTLRTSWPSPLNLPDDWQPTDEDRAKLACDDLGFEVLTGTSVVIRIGAICRATVARLQSWEVDKGRRP